MHSREKIIKICEQGVLDRAAYLFNTHKNALAVYASYEGAANLVFEYPLNGAPMILRITYTPERNRELIEAELHFVNYLAEQGVRVSKPLFSRNGNLVETIEAEGIPFHIVSFVKGKGMRVPDNGYRYRTDAPIEEYFQNWGETLGKLHALSKDYQPPADRQKRPGWFDLHKERLDFDKQVPERLNLVRNRIQATFDEVKSLPADRACFGLIHGDFNDGNFTVDYTNGDITVFDFDDSCYFWFMYELASAWEGGIGRVMFRGLSERVAFMDHYMEQVLEGYQRENSLSDAWLAQLPLFIRLIQIEEFLHFVQYIDGENNEVKGGLDYKIKCIEDEIPYMGFFDSIYSPQNPFAL